MKCIAAAAVLLFSGPALAQGVDPSVMMDQLIQQKMLESQERFQDQQRQRLLDQREQAYDRQTCIRAGYRDPNVEQCVRDSAAWRRGARLGQPGQAPSNNCTTVDLGGIFDTFCD
jgi:hypothetical protein